MRKLLYILPVLFVAMMAMVQLSYALTIDEAVAAALENNHRIKQYRHLEDSALEGVGKARAGFLPSLDLGYAFTEKDEAIFAVGSRYSVFQVEATYNLFNGMSDLKGLRGAMASADAARYRKNAIRADVVLAARKAFIGVLRAGRSAEVAVEGVELLEKQKRDAELFYREGLIARNDLLRVEVELASARQGLIEAEGGLRVRRKGLERVMGVGLVDEQKIEDFSGLPDVEDMRFETLVDEMLRKRSEIMYLEALRDSSRYAMEAERSGYLPSIDLSLLYEEFGDSAFPDGIETSYDYDSKVMLTATWNLFDGFETRHGVREARYLMRAAEEELEDTKDEMALQLREALEGYRVAKGKLDVAEAAVSQAEENYRVTESQFRLRAATTVDQLDARFFLTRARNQYNTALYDLHESVAALDRVLEKSVDFTVDIREVKEGPPED
jgi:outer membrane protein TolC